jgi:hypothetical protein
LVGHRRCSWFCFAVSPARSCAVAGIWQSSFHANARTQGMRALRVADWRGPGAGFEARIGTVLLTKTRLPVNAARRFDRQDLGAGLTAEAHTNWLWAWVGKRRAEH